MILPAVKPLTKAQIEASNDNRRERTVWTDIRKIDALNNTSDHAQFLQLHRYLDGKYQCCISDWGKGMWGHVEGKGFVYESLDTDSLMENLSMMKPKLESFMLGWNDVKQSVRYAAPTASDVNVTVNNSLAVNISFNQVRTKIQEMESLTDEQAKEALDKVSEIESVVQSEGSKKTKWEKIKPILFWLADKSFDVAMTILPLLLQVQK